MSALGTEIAGRYRLDAVIGRGGMSTVYKAFDTVLERPVAIKLMHREIATDSDQLERFRREARAVAQLNHPHVVSVIDAGEEPLGEDGYGGGSETPYIVLEYVDGETLKSVIRRDGPLEIPQALAYSIEIARALGAAHERQIVHRDVKPQNILIDPEGGAKITDFGIARSLTEEGLTMAGRVLGTTDYVSPEQALGQPVTPQSDLYSLGIVLYEMLTGDVPFHGETPVAVAMKHVREDVPDVQARRPQLAAATASVIDRALAKDLSQRYPDAAEMVGDLEQVLAIEASRTGQTTGEVTTVLRTLRGRARRRLPWRMRHPARWLVSLALLAAIVAVVLVLARRQRAPRDRRRAAAPRRTAASSGISLSAVRRQRLQPVRDRARKTATRSGTSSTATPPRPGAPRPTTKATCARPGGTGLGIYLDAAPGVAARAIADPDADARVRGAVLRRRPHRPLAALRRPDAAGGAGLERPDRREPVRAQRQADPAAPAAAPHRYYLLWMTTLPPGSQSATIADITLFR